jgi:selenide, water dikinase
MASGVQLELFVNDVPLLPGALEAIGRGAIPAGLLANRDFAECVTADAANARVEENVRALLYDPQTAGGLLVSVAGETSSQLQQSLHAAGVPAARIGRVPAPYTQGSGEPLILLG